MSDLENTLLLETSKGTVKIALRPDLAPGHVTRIKELAREGFYDGIIFHRVIAGFMAQTGCPKGTGTGNSKKPDLKAEFNAEPHVRGTCSMARTSAPHSASAQFFINVSNNDFLNHSAPTPQGWGYCVFGKVVDGTDVVDKIRKVKTGSKGMHQDVPVEDVIIEKAEVV
jgi:peptidylprolyl isomerase